MTMTDPYAYKPIPRQISTLMHIRENLKDDNELSLKVARSGKFVADSHWEWDGIVKEDNLPGRGKELREAVEA